MNDHYFEDSVELGFARFNAISEVHHLRNFVTSDIGRQKIEQASMLLESLTDEDFYDEEDEAEYDNDDIPF